MVTANDETSPGPALTGRRRWIALCVLCTGMLMIVLDVTVVNVALPAIQDDLGFAQSSLAWVVNAYLIAFGGLLLLAGRLGDLIGRRTIFLAGLAVFTAASLACGAAQSQELLVAARFVQGVGGAMTSAVILGMIVTMFPGAREQAKAIGVYAFVASAGGAVGLLAGGVLTQSINWHWIFFVNVPIGVIGVAAGRVLVPESRDQSDEQALDVPGLVVSAGGLFALTFALTEANRYGWTSGTIIGLFAAAVVLLVSFVVIERRRRLPMLDLSLFRSGNFAGANLVAVLVTLAMFGVFFFMSLFVQQILGYSPVEAGAIFLPMTCLIIVVAPIAGKLSDRLGSRWPMTIGMLLLGGSLLLFAGLDEGSDFWSIFPGLIMGGLGMALVMTPMSAAAMGSVPVFKAGVAAGVLNTSRMVGLTFGIALMGAIVAARWPGGFAVAPAQPGALSGGLSLAFRINAGIALATAGLAAGTLAGPKTRRPVLPGRRNRRPPSTARVKR